MKRIFFTLAFASVLLSCKTASTSTNDSKSVTDIVKVAINLNDVKEDKVLVTITSPKISTNEVTYSIPKIVPGTYSVDDYGKYIEDFKAFDSKLFKDFDIKFSSISTNILEIFIFKSK